MTTIYRVLNPDSGTYINCDTKEKAVKLVAEAAFSFYLKHTHGAPYSMVTFNDDGTETWRSARGEETINPEEQKALLAELELRMGATTNGP